MLGTKWIGGEASLKQEAVKVLVEEKMLGAVGWGERCTKGEGVWVKVPRQEKV